MGTKHHDPQSETPDVSHIKNLDIMHEGTDVNARAVFYFIIGLAVSIGVAAVFMWLLFKVLNQRELRHEDPPASLVGIDRDHLPPEPRLQGAPGHRNLPLQDWAEYTGQQNDLVNSYGWVNREAGIVRLPIERAMELIVERGLPTSAPRSADSQGAMPAGEHQGTMPTEHQGAAGAAVGADAGRAIEQHSGKGKQQ